MSKRDIWAVRRQNFCPAQSISYSNTSPLMAVGGYGAYLVDEKGNRYLDTRNNVCHVGHQNRLVAACVARQVATLNSNTRYLHPNVALLSEKLLAKFPPALSVVFFVNSGSEANDLALRLAKAHTGSEHVVTVSRAYHGHTASVIKISPYKFAGKGGSGQSRHVQVVPCPDPYSGRYRDKATGVGDQDIAEHYAQHVRDAIKRAGGRVGSFFIESGMSVAGVVLPPSGYLRKCYKAVRAAGGVCVADEVQTGFGRFGAHFWGFQQQGVVPDIVTMGKPFGNGMPLAAVVTTRAISNSFANGMEYFNTFGGNPVCAAAGLAVLEVIEQKGLQRLALETGEYLQNEVRRLALKHVLIGDVRGSGLFIGIEFVRDRATREPATAELAAICSRLKDRRILTSVDGAFDNVMVIKPPMVFGKREVDLFVTNLDQVLTTLGPIDATTYTRTPT